MSFDKWAAKLLGIETATAEDVGFIFQPILNRLFGLSVALWPGDDASLEAQAAMLERLNVEALEEVVPEVQDRLRAGAREALTHGFRVAREEAVAAGAKPPALTKRERALSAIVETRIDMVPVIVRTKVAKSKVLIRHSTTMSDVLESLAVAQQAQTSSVSIARQVTNESSNDALTTISHKTSDLVSVWRAERDACVHCLAYQGHTDTGSGYPKGLTFGDTPIKDGIVHRPPLHPNCRCTQSLVHKDVVAPLSKALKREAKRSVLRGWSRPSESEAARLKAAKRLVSQGNTLPKSVNAYAEAAIRAGEFKRGRTPPT